MKRTIIAITVTLCCLTCVQAQVPNNQELLRIGLIYRLFNPGIDPTGGLGGGQRNPETPFYISQEGHTIYFDTTPHPAFTLSLLEIGTEQVVYVTTVGETDATLVLPATFTGDYEIRLAPDDDYYYGGVITL